MIEASSVTENKKLTVINLYGGPGSGKSTTAAGLFYLAKLKGYDIELVTEFAKDMVYQKRWSVFTEQDYIFAKQHHRQRRLVQSGVRYCVTDSPLILAHLYLPEDYYKSFVPFINEAFRSFNNTNIFIRRVKKYNPKGRNQTEDEAREIDRRNLDLLFALGERFFVLDGDATAAHKIDDLMNTKEGSALPKGVIFVDPEKVEKAFFYQMFEKLGEE